MPMRSRKDRMEKEEFHCRPGRQKKRNTEREKKRIGRLVGVGMLGSCLVGCASVAPKVLPAASPIVSVGGQSSSEAQTPTVARSENLTPFQHAVVASLERQTAANTVYDSSYYRGGVPPANVGVCSDVAIRAFAAAGVDLKTAVTADIQAHQRCYPLSQPDPNIDHRRCRNLVVYFRPPCKRVADRTLESALAARRHRLLEHRRQGLPGPYRRHRRPHRSQRQSDGRPAPPRRLRH